MKRAMLTVLVAIVLVGAAPATKPADTDLYTMSDDAFARSPRVTAQIDFANVDYEVLSAIILRETNRHRVAAKLPKFSHLAKLDEASKIHADDMNREKFFAHENPNDPKKREPINRVTKVGLDPRLVAENIATYFGIQYESGKPAYVLDSGEVSAQPNGRPIPPHTYLSFGRGVVEQWMRSPPHHHNIMLPDAKYLGAACVLATASDKKEAKDGNEEDESKDDPAFHKFYCVQVFFTPMREVRKK